jgi:hypothetical protein
MHVAHDQCECYHPHTSNPLDISPIVKFFDPPFLLHNPFIYYLVTSEWTLSLSNSKYSLSSVGSKLASRDNRKFY